MKRLTKEEVLLRCNKKHDNFYQYDFSRFINTGSKITISCPIHGKFEQNVRIHYNGSRCPGCIGKEVANTAQFIVKRQ